MFDIETLDDSGLKSLSYWGSNNYPQQAKDIRYKFKDYFASREGFIDWQDDKFKTKLKAMYIQKLLKNISQKHL